MPDAQVKIAAVDASSDSDHSAVLLRKGDPDFKKAVDDAIVAYYKSGKINDTYKTWFESPIPPKGLNLMFPMSDELKALIANPTDKAADDKPAEEKKS